MAVGTVFFLAELGDKTTLVTVTLATTEGLVGTWAGSTVGMIVADGLAIAVGKAWVIDFKLRPYASHHRLPSLSLQPSCSPTHCAPFRPGARPLFPLLAGPGAIVATIVFFGKADGTAEWLSVVAAIACALSVSLITLRFSGIVKKIFVPPVWCC